MLVLSRKLNETIVIDGNILVKVVDIRGSQVRLGIEAPGGIPILREELLCAPARATTEADPTGAPPQRGGRTRNGKGRATRHYPSGAAQAPARPG
jgi:carbon storage regulator